MSDTSHPYEGEEWLELLRAAVAEAGAMRPVAARLGCSVSSVSHLLSGSYRADPAHMARRIEETYGRRLVACPVLGPIPITECAAHRNAPFAATNPVRVRLWRACQSCPNNPNRNDKKR